MFFFCCLVRLVVLLLPSRMSLSLSRAHSFLLCLALPCWNFWFPFVFCLLRRYLTISRWPVSERASKSVWVIYSIFKFDWQQRKIYFREGGQFCQVEFSWVKINSFFSRHLFLREKKRRSLSSRSMALNGIGTRRSIRVRVTAVRMGRLIQLRCHIASIRSSARL